MNFSFTSIKNALVARLSLLDNWSINILSLGTYSNLLDTIAYGIEKMTFYMEYNYKNTFLKTAEDLVAIIVKAWELGYSPHRKIGATGRVKVSADPSFTIPLATYTGTSVNIPRWTVFQDNDNQVFLYSTSDAIYYHNTVIGNRNLTMGDSPVNLGNSKVGFNVTAHGFPVGQYVTISGSADYDGDYLIDAATTPNRIVIVFPGTFVLETFSGSEKIFTGHLYVPVAEGKPKTFTYLASGQINETLTVFSDSADNYNVEVFIVDSNGNILYNVTITDDVFLINSLTNYYCTVESLPSFQGFTVEFGDGITSKKLNSGDRVLVKYADTKGSSGNISTEGLITKFQVTPNDLTGNPAALFVTNDSLISAGKEYETIESIRHNARNLFYAGYRAHTKTDWETILNNHPDIQKSVVWTDYDINPAIVGFTNSIVNISAVSVNGTSLNSSQTSDITINYLKEKKSVTDIVSFQPLKEVGAQFRINAVLNPVPANTVVQLIYNALVAKYGILNTAFAQNIYESDAIRIISDSSSDILYHHTEIWHVERSEAYSDIDSSISRTVIVSLLSVSQPDLSKQIYISPGKIELWIRRKINGVLQNPKRIGKTNTVTNTIFEGDNSYTIVGGVINYTTNQITYNVSDIINDIPPDGGTTFGVLNPTDTDPDGYFLRIAYQTQDGNGDLINDIRLPYFYNITDVSSEDVLNYFTFLYP